MRRIVAIFLSLTLASNPVPAVPVMPQALPEIISLDTDLSILLAISRSALPVMDPPPAELMLASYVTTPSAISYRLVQAGTAANNAVMPSGDLTIRVNVNTCGASSCGTASGLQPSVEMRSEFSSRQYPDAGPVTSSSRSADTSVGPLSSNYGGGSATAEAKREYDRIRSDLSNAASELASANRELDSAKSEYSTAQSSLNNELDALRREGENLNRAIQARNAAASDRNQAAAAANSAKQDLHNAVTENSRIKQDIVSQTAKKENLDRRLTELEDEVKTRSNELASNIPQLATSEITDTQRREENKDRENNAIEGHNRSAVAVNDKSRLQEGLDSIKDFLSDANKASGVDGSTALPSSQGEPGYIAPVSTIAQSLAPGLNAQPGDRVAELCGSIIRIDSLAVGEAIPLVGVPFQLLYFTDRSSGRIGDYQIRVPLKEPTDGAVNSVSLQLSIAARSLNKAFNTNQDSFDLVWNGRDNRGEQIIAKAPYEAKLTIQKNGSTISRKITSFAGNFKPEYLGLGGWGTSVIHYFSIAESQVYFANGSTKRVSGKRLANGNFLIPSESGAEVYLFNSQGLHLETRHGLTGARLYVFSYDDNKQLQSMEDAFNNKTTITKSDSTIVIRGPHGAEAKLQLDSDGRLGQVTNPLGDAYQVKYSKSGLMSEFVRPDGHASRFSYDDLGYLKQDQSPSGHAVTFDGKPSRKVTGALDVKTASGEGRISSYTISKSENGDYRRVTTNPNGTSVQMDYRPSVFERRTSEEEDVYTAYSEDVRFGKDVSFASRSRYSIPGADHTVDTQVTQALEANANRRDFSDFRALKTNIIANSRVTQIEYLQDTKELIVTSPAGRKVLTRTTPQGKPLFVQRANFQPTQYSYDDHGRLISITKGAQSTTFTYGQDGLLSSISDALGRTHRYVYDRAGRVIIETLSNEQAIAYRYDKNGNRTSVTPPGRPPHLFSFNPLDAIAKYSPPESQALPHAETHYKYSGDNELIEVQLPSGNGMRMTYGQSDGLLKSVSSADGTYMYEYGTGAKLKQLTSPDGIVMNFEYFGRLPKQQSVRLPSGQTVTLSFAYGAELTPSVMNFEIGDSFHGVPFSYDLDGMLIRVGDERLEIDAETAMLKQVDLGRVSESYTVDSNFEQYASMSAKSDSGVQLYSETLVRDKIGRVVGRNESDDANQRAYVYEYDAAGRLSEVLENGRTTSQYVYDSNGNRLSGIVGGETFTASYDDRDRMIEYKSNTYGYGADGDLEWKRNATTSETTNYHYDSFGNLKRVGRASQSVIEYVIDGLNRRVAKKVGGQLKEQYVYQSQLQIAAVLDGDGKVVSRFIYGTKANSPDYMVKDGRRYKIITDNLGSPRIVVDVDSGEVAQRIRYDEFGQIIEDSRPGFQPLGFAGGLYDPDTKLIRFGARDYDPEIGRWTNRDPILFDGGDSNLYGYVLNDPLNFTDPGGTVAAALLFAPWIVDTFIASSAIGAGWYINNLINVYARPSGKERASDIPSWAKGQEALPGEKPRQTADRLVSEKEGPDYDVGPGSDFNRLKKFFERKNRNQCR